MIAFDELAIFPPGPMMYDYDTGGGPGMDTTIVDKDSGYSTTFAHYGSGRRRYENVNFTNRTMTELMVIKQFFWARSGTAMGFRFWDVNEFTSASDGISLPTPTDQLVVQDEAGNWRLAKQYAGGAINRYIFKPIDGIIANGRVVGEESLEVTIVFADGGVPITDPITVDTTTGIVTGYTPSGAFTAGFYFHTPVRFDGGLTLTINDFGVGSVSGISLRELIYPTQST